MKKQENEVLDARAGLCAKKLPEAFATLAGTVRAKLAPGERVIADESNRHAGAPDPERR